LESRWAPLEGYSKAAGKYPNTCHQPIGEEAELPSGYWQKRGSFCSFLLRRCISVYKNNKSKTNRKIFKTLSGYFPNYFLSHQTTFSQTQMSVTAPLM
jgi:hypothetical protein